MMEVIPHCVGGQMNYESEVAILNSRMGWIVLLLIAALLSYLLFAPFFIEVDSDREWYSFRFHRLAFVRLTFEDNSVFLIIKVAGWYKKTDLLANRKVVKKKTVKRTDRRRTRKITMQTVKHLIQSFKVNRLSIHIDSGNMALNGLLFPVFYHLGRRSGKDISVNFTGENRIILQVENNLAHLAWAFFK